MPNGKLGICCCDNFEVTDLADLHETPLKDGWNTKCQHHTCSKSSVSLFAHKEDTWWMQVLERTGMELCRNASYSGSTVSGPSQDDADGRYACGDRRIADLAGETGEKPDLL